MSVPLRWPEVAEVVRKMIEAGELKPGDITPPATGLSALTGAHSDTCRKALLHMTRDGELDPPMSRSGRPRVPGGDGPGPAERELAAALAAARRAAGLTQKQLAERAGLSPAAIYWAETGRFRRPAPSKWARLDRAAKAGGKVMRLHADWQASRNSGTGPSPQAPSQSSTALKAG